MHPFFDAVRDAAQEASLEEMQRLHAPPDTQLYFEFEDEDVDVAMLRALVVEQVLVDYPYATVRWSDVSLQDSDSDGDEDDDEQDATLHRQPSVQTAILRFQAQQARERDKLGDALTEVCERAAALPAYTPTRAFIRLVRKRSQVELGAQFRARSRPSDAHSKHQQQ
jgi:hypothetical protein